MKPSKWLRAIVSDEIDINREIALGIMNNVFNLEFDRSVAPTAREESIVIEAVTAFLKQHGLSVVHHDTWHIGDKLGPAEDEVKEDQINFRITNLEAIEMGGSSKNNRINPVRFIRTALMELINAAEQANEEYIGKQPNKD